MCVCVCLIRWAYGVICRWSVEQNRVWLSILVAELQLRVFPFRSILIRWSLSRELWNSPQRPSVFLLASRGLSVVLRGRNWTDSIPRWTFELQERPVAVGHRAAGVKPMLALGALLKGRTPPLVSSFTIFYSFTSLSCSQVGGGEKERGGKTEAAGCHVESSSELDFRPDNMLSDTALSCSVLRPPSLQHQEGAATFSIRKIIRATCKNLFWLLLFFVRIQIFFFWEINSNSEKKKTEFWDYGSILRLNSESWEKKSESSGKNSNFQIYIWNYLIEIKVKILRSQNSNRFFTWP